ncbi:acyl-CoA desaturase, partial [Streptomyces fulvissimus]|nr:acyl-CoA desaturase [Streptomyces microflavus]
MTSTSEMIDEKPRTSPPDSASAPSATLGGDRKGTVEQLALLLFIVVPFLALLAAVPLAWGWGVSWLDLGLMVFFYFLGCHGITIGFHRY